MLAYLANRLMQVLFVLWAAFTVAFVVLFLLPGDPVLTMLSGAGDPGHVDPALVEALRVRYGLDRPLPVQYIGMLADVARGDLGTSMLTGQRVTRMLIQAAAGTVSLAVSAFAVATLGGVSLAWLAAYSRRPVVREFLLSLPPLGVSLPTFWVGLVLLQVVSFRLGLLPAVGSGGWRTLILPTLTLALPIGATIAQVFAKSLRMALDQPYIETALAKGAKWSRVVNRHAVRNSAVSAVTLLGVLAGDLLSGAVVVEIVFGRPGVGRLTVTAVQTQDIPVVLGVVLLGAAVYALVNLMVDLVYPLIDPRIVARGERQPDEER